MTLPTHCDISKQEREVEIEIVPLLLAAVVVAWFDGQTFVTEAAVDDARTSATRAGRRRRTLTPSTVLVVRVHPLDRSRRSDVVAATTLTLLLRNGVTFHHLAMRLTGQRTARRSKPANFFKITIVSFREMACTWTWRRVDLIFKCIRFQLSLSVRFRLKMSRRNRRVWDWLALILPK